MSRHEGVSCDACLRSNFRGRRYKCLICYDYDLCATCHEAGATTTRHSAQHPMQCILTRSDFDLFYGGELVSSEQPQSLACPHCGKLGLTELTLAEHVTAQHADATTQVVCPVCASVPNGEPNHVTEDLPTHLSVDHGRASSSGVGGGGGGGARELISFGEEPTPAGLRSTARRVPHPSRTVGGPRMRRFNTHFRDSMDPITELLSQLSGVRRSGSTSASSTSSAASASAAMEAAANGSSAALQQLQRHLQMERQQYAQVVRQSTDRARRLTEAPSGPAAASLGGSTGVGPVGAPLSRPAATVTIGTTPSAAGGAKPGASAAEGASGGSQFLLARIRDEEDSETDAARRRLDRADRALFVQEIVLSTLSTSLEECAASAEESSAAASAAAAPAAAASTTSTSSQTTGGEPTGPPRPATSAAAAAAGAPQQGRPGGAAPAAAAPGTTSRPVGAAARSAALAASVPAAGRGGVRGVGVVGLPTGAVAAAAALAPRVVPVRGRRKPARPPPAAAVDTRGALPAGDPPPPH